MPTKPQNMVCVEARFRRLPELLALLADNMSLLDSAIDPDLRLRVSLAIEELFANTINHGYRGESDQPVWLAVKTDACVLHVTYADAADAFNPFVDVDQLDTQSEEGVGQRRVGGLGRLLIYKMAQSCRYRRDAGRNIVILEYLLAPPLNAS